jgi:hypothetical protein
VQAQEELDAYLSDYDPDVSGEGRVVGIRGEHGSGKTHLEYYLKKRADTNAKAPLQAYVKIETTSFLDAYRALVAQIDYGTLRHALAKVASLIAAEMAQGSAVTAPAVEVMANDSRAVYEYLSAGLLSATRIATRQREWVGAITNDEEFMRAVSNLQDQRLGRQAYDWLLGKQLSPTALGEIGVSGTMDDRMAEVALRLFATMFRIARQPFIVYLDQIERLAREASDETRSRNAAALKSLSEIFAREQALLALAGAPDGWEALPQDFPGRLTRFVDLPTLSLETAFALLHVYQSAPAGEDFVANEESGAVDVFPYSPSAVREIVRISRGNMRGILRLAYRTYVESAPSKSTTGQELDASDVATASRHVDEYFDTDTIADSVQAQLRERGLAFERDVQLEGTTVDFAVPPTGEIVAVIDILSAIFDEDEVRSARDYLTKAEAILKRFPRARLIVIVAGYASEKVQDSLRKVATDYIVYSPVEFEHQFAEALDTVETRLRSSQDSVATADDGQRVAQIGAIQEQLAEETVIRQSAAALRDERIGAFVATQSAADIQRARDEGARLRLEVETQESERVASARRARQAQTTALRELLRSEAEAERIGRAAMSVRRQGVFAVVLLGIVLGSSIVFTPQYSNFDFGPGTFDTGKFAYLFGIGLLLGILIFALATTSFSYFGESLLIGIPRRVDRDEQLARAPVDDVRALDRIASQMSKRAPVRLRRLLDDVNPQVRYVAARALTLAGVEMQVPEMRGAISRERWPVAKRGLFLLLINSHQSDTRLWGALEFFSELLVTADEFETLTIVDMIARADATGRGPVRSKLELIESTLVENARALPAHIVVHALCTGVVSPRSLYRWRRPRTQSRASELAADFAATLQLPGSPGDDKEANELISRLQAPALLLASLFGAAKSPDATAAQKSALFDSVFPETLDQLARIYGLDDEHSLGYYPELVKARLYDSVYEFLVDLRLEYVERRLTA